MKKRGRRDQRGGELEAFEAGQRGQDPPHPASLQRQGEERRQRE